ncbi:MAG TPA: cytochrome c biogenesis heme-transporting ATPase CcmA [Burkholderiales bacterium]|nr:cytochrome c biogenesis heme-transporting ATPase CcmA [Burkholderiales bacterium]
MLEARKIECIRGDRRLFHGLSFRLEAKQALRISGDNGSGKTSLLRMVAGLSPTQDGEICWNQARITLLAEDYRRELLFIGHANGLKEDLSALENLQHALVLAGRHVEFGALRAALADQGLAAIAQLPVRVLSQGQKRRVALARLMFCADKTLWILDEPFGALDTIAVAYIEKLLLTHLQRGGMLLYTTHQEVALPGAQSLSVELGHAR